MPIYNHVYVLIFNLLYTFTQYVQILVFFFSLNVVSKSQSSQGQLLLNYEINLIVYFNILMIVLDVLPNYFTS